MGQYFEIFCINMIFSYWFSVYFHLGKKSGKVLKLKRFSNQSHNGFEDLVHGLVLSSKWCRSEKSSLPGSFSAKLEKELLNKGSHWETKMHFSWYLSGWSWSSFSPETILLVLHLNFRDLNSGTWEIWVLLSSTWHPLRDGRIKHPYAW